jgi:REP element-mobilizing transposase RayT
MEKNIAFEPGLYYHEILKANSDTLLFKDDQDRKYFLNKMRYFLLPCCEIFSYAILGNHVHLLIRPHPQRILSRLCLQLHRMNLDLFASNLDEYLSEDYLIKIPEGLTPFEGSVDKQIRYCIRGLKHSYSQYQAKKYQRTGMQWNPERFTKVLGDKDDVGRTVLYIHKNPVYHGMVHQPEEWQFSSFHEIRDQEDRLVRSEVVLDVFGHKDQFLQEHVALPGEYGRKPSRMRLMVS